ncbi:MAG: hypothetical protein IPM29_17440 [Planctomycetes bacterium]|nr:hypothetical protein [Planctomycetota bacterium]
MNRNRSTAARCARFLLVLLVSSLWLVACTGPEPADDGPGARRLSTALVDARIEKGMSSGEVLEVLGTPNIQATDGEGGRVWTWDKVSTDRVDERSSVFGTLLVLGASSSSRSSSTTQRTLTIVIKFDADDRVKDVAYHATQF